MSHVTTHVLDAVSGAPAVGCPVLLEGPDGEVARGVTDADGRVAGLGPDSLPPSTYRLTFDTGAWSEAAARPTFYPEVTITFTVDDRHCHVPLLLSPYAYSTYRGS